jgi:hypothetical protein
MIEKLQLVSVAERVEYLPSGRANHLRSETPLTDAIFLYAACGQVLNPSNGFKKNGLSATETSCKKS